MADVKRKLVVALSILAFYGACGWSQEPAPVAFPKLAPAPMTAGAPATVSIAAEPVSNQQLAAAVAQALQRSGKLRGYRMDIQVTNGQVELLGRVGDMGQKEDAVRLARGVAGVISVRDRLSVGSDGGIIAVQNVPEQGPPPKKLDAQPPVEVAPAMPMYPIMPGYPPGCGPQGCPPPGCAYPNEPMAISPSVPNDIFQRPPPLPPYAWPTYAPYNNYSRVAYPTLYPQDAWPGIGPFYPFPKVPTGWRSVTLSWQDGYWWYGRGVSGHDWWRVRYK